MSPPGASEDFGRDGALAHEAPGSITAIGSCRITGPLRALAKTAPMTLNQSGVYGYSHSSAEVLAHLRHLHGGPPPPRELMPLLSAHPSRARPRHSLSEVYVFEISSAKDLRVDGHPVQLNYFNRHFADFLAEPERARRFWAFARGTDRSAMAGFLREEPSFQRLGHDDQSILTHTTLKMATPDALARDISQLRRMSPDHLFVTHFDAALPGGALLRARAAFLCMLRSVLADVGVIWFDPSAEVAAKGQAHALADPATSFAHYAPAFEAELGAFWWRRYLRPMLRERQLDRDLRMKIKARAQNVQLGSQASLSAAPDRHS